eukprot:TRINITY_DN8541_c0_g1_i1.p1 TRINITY_DN8541_c0_g1~~TRINITY_DN8541_c0_g1_i1.p1  ORF type:complete len:96 (+),score=5.60 TRINITY_DN8541_c0_g1_i1:639-926(+)
MDFVLTNTFRTKSSPSFLVSIIDFESEHVLILFRPVYLGVGGKPHPFLQFMHLVVVARCRDLIGTTSRKSQMQQKVPKDNRIMLIWIPKIQIRKN